MVKKLAAIINPYGANISIPTKIAYFRRAVRYQSTATTLTAKEYTALGLDGKPVGSNLYLWGELFYINDIKDLKGSK